MPPRTGIPFRGPSIHYRTFRGPACGQYQSCLAARFSLALGVGILANIGGVVLNNIYFDSNYPPVLPFSASVLVVAPEVLAAAAVEGFSVLEAATGAGATNSEDTFFTVGTRGFWNTGAAGGAVDAAWTLVPPVPGLLLVTGGGLLAAGARFSLFGCFTRLHMKIKAKIYQTTPTFLDGSKFFFCNPRIWAEFSGFQDSALSLGRSTLLLGWDMATLTKR